MAKGLAGGKSRQARACLTGGKSYAAYRGVVAHAIQGPLMKWIWRRRHETTACSPSTLPEAKAARQKSEQELDRVMEQKTDVARVSEALKDMPTKDHLSEVFTQSLRKRLADG